jgi:hypothetical protein
MATIIDLELEFGSSPVSPFGVVSNGVPGLHTDPLRDGSVLSLLLRELAFDSERLVGRLLDTRVDRD